MTCLEILTIVLTATSAVGVVVTPLLITWTARRRTMREFEAEYERIFKRAGLCLPIHPSRRRLPKLPFAKALKRVRL